ncbi:acyltransferase domain-containing protein [Streptomyces sp. BE147]|uniref:acyltransferase domain-containing protein n=1 Tax=Streptomyces sp. BE147 TaxID=3002524 RepID=UPI002E76EF47|nr:acyltransferase domain-containing protein [Streptomyces sp. BE147]MEE1737874.1 acyltransferase domain-containing protein [Streptomyces sp. BE147]
MAPPRTAFLFPGAGSFTLRELHRLLPRAPQAREQLLILDTVSASYGFEPLEPVLAAPAPPRNLTPGRHPQAGEALTFFASTAAHHIQTSKGMAPDVLMGHSLGELTALRFAGALSTDAVARVICERATALERSGLPPGGMLALALDARRTQALLDFYGAPGLALAAVNSTDQSVVSGPIQALAELECVLEAAFVPAARLDINGAFHNPLMSEVAQEIAAGCHDLDLRAPHTPVFSPVLGRYIDSASDVSEVLLHHTDRPVRFLAALLKLHRDGVGTFVELGGSDALSKFVKSCLPESAVTVRTPPNRHLKVPVAAQPTNQHESGASDANT